MKEDIQGVYDEDFLKFLFQLVSDNLKETPTVEKKISELIRKEEERQT